jgi:hypothetical protein
VAAAAEGAIHEDLPGARVKDIDQLCGEYGLVFGGHVRKVR